MMIKIYAEGDGTLRTQIYWNADYYYYYDLRRRGWYTEDTDLLER